LELGDCGTLVLAEVEVFIAADNRLD
jgi:hypothetical protein